MADEKKIEKVAEELTDESLDEVSGGVVFKSRKFGKIDPARVIKKIREAKNNRKNENVRAASDKKEYLA